MNIEIPEEWNYVRYEDVFYEIREPIEFDDDEDYDLITVKRRNVGLVSRGVLKGKDILTKNLYSIQEGDFLMARMQIVHGACGLVPKSLEHAKISGSYLRLKSSDKLNLKYLNFLSHTPLFYQQTFVSSVGSNIEKMNLDQKHWFAHYFPLPTKREIIKITSILSNLDELIDKYNDTIETTKKLKKSLIKKLLTHGIAHKKFKKVIWHFRKEIEIPEEWDIFLLNDLCKKRENVNNKSELYVGIENIESGTGFLKFKSNVKDFLILKPFQKNDVLYSKLRPYLEKVWLADEDGYCSSDIYPLVCSKKIIPEFLHMYLLSKQFLKFAIATTAGGNIPKTRWNDIKNFKIFLSPISEQQKITSIFFEINEKIIDLQSKKTNFENLKKGLMQKLLTGQIRV